HVRTFSRQVSDDAVSRDPVPVVKDERLAWGHRALRGGEGYRGGPGPRGRQNRRGGRVKVSNLPQEVDRALRGKPGGVIHPRKPRATLEQRLLAVDGHRAGGGVDRAHVDPLPRGDVEAAALPDREGVHPLMGPERAPRAVAEHPALRGAQALREALLEKLEV